MGRLHHTLVARMLPAVPAPILWRFSRRYIAGSTLEDAARLIRDLNDEGCAATLDVLGEDVNDPEETRRNAALYREALERIAAEDLDANISVKLTAMGLEVDRQLCIENVRGILETARGYENFVRFDMEDASTTDATLDVYRHLRVEGWDELGLVLQSRLRRTLDDIDALKDLHPNYRLCKGIYLEPIEIAWQHPEAVNRNFIRALEVMLEQGCYVGIATHDERLVWEALALIDRHGLSRDDYEFQMLLGVAEDLRRVLVDQGHRMRVYIPYGEHWRAYSLRRLRENPEIVGHILSNLFSRGS